MRIFLTGFMGSGKSYVGSRLSRRLGLPFIDLDQYIEQRAGMSIAELFAQIGEASFRDLETSMLREFLALPMFVLATGGGTPCCHDNMKWMNTHGRTVFLDPDPAILIRRLTNERAKRPLLHGTDDLAELIDRKMTQRRKIYEQAHIHVVQHNPKQDIPRLLEKRITAYPSN
ncbi:shikimate kinase [Neolewinella litorea]|uniref:Shikimate kinase n=1 Tax=Neolewinella litorea TaxID=2562452 RepID=A0A4S4NND9_9BACT|nr:shikimate kinase [Neolewinella litorea]THH41362.1 shikimate kinase [Neolewinella litorea]